MAALRLKVTTGKTFCWFLVRYLKTKWQNSRSVLVWLLTGGRTAQSGLDRTVRWFNFSPCFHLLTFLREKKKKSPRNEDKRLMQIEWRCKQVVPRQRRRVTLFPTDAAIVTMATFETGLLSSTGGLRGGNFHPEAAGCWVNTSKLKHEKPPTFLVPPGF